MPVNRLSPGCGCCSTGPCGCGNDFTVKMTVVIDMRLDTITDYRELTSGTWTKYLFEGMLALNGTYEYIFERSALDDCSELVDTDAETTIGTFDVTIDSGATVSKTMKLRFFTENAKSPSEFAVQAIVPEFHYNATPGQTEEGGLLDQFQVDFCGDPVFNKTLFTFFVRTRSTPGGLETTTAQYDATVELVEDP